jgi:hypothetical protein
MNRSSDRLRQATAPRAGENEEADRYAVLAPRLTGFVLHAFAGSINVAAVDADLDRLTEREREVMP